MIRYSAEAVEEREFELADFELRTDAGCVTWVDVQGVGDTALLTALGNALGVHDLALEDAVHTHQRSKLELFGEQLFVVTRMTRPDELHTEQLAVLVVPGLVLTIQEESGDWFDPVRARIRRDGSRIRSSGPDYLAYALIDAATDSFFPLLEKYDDRLDELEEQVMVAGDESHVSELYALRRDLQGVRRHILPLRDMLSRFGKGDLPLVQDATLPFLRDCYDHAHQILDIADSYREQATGLIEVSVSMAAQRMNEVMKMLTIMASIFIPLTFLAGIYGMNFDPAASPWNMPELAWAFGYPAVLGAMLAITVAMLLFFRRKGWIGARTPRGARGSEGR